MTGDRLRILSVVDGKPGHMNQVRALVAGIERRRAVDAAEYVVGSEVSPAGLWAVDLILCAGRRTHATAHTFKKRSGARLVACMRPAWRWGRFDLCFVPRHDGAAKRANVVETVGAIVNTRPSDSRDESRGVILIGGESKHHGVDVETLASAVEEIVRRDSGVAWELTTSRRTPRELEERLIGMEASNLKVTPAARTPAGWVGEQLSRSGRAWVTEDSVSMLCEAVTSGCATGVLTMVRKKSGSRVARCVDEFTGELGLATTFGAWRGGIDLSAPAEPLDEADRCAGIILERFFSENA